MLLMESAAREAARDLDRAFELVNQICRAARRMRRHGMRGEIGFLKGDYDHGWPI
jgi:hypothetical protein